ncbi:MAG: EVE domain-containing protein, partial [Saprospiraceae bacterium]
MNHWLIKSEPFVYSFDDLQREGKIMWDGVRNYAARNHLRAMKTGDLVLFYHSREGLEVVG